MYEMWLEMVEQWANKHGITVDQAVSILYFDYVTKENNIVADSLYWDNSDELAIRYKYEKKKV